jgi:hypothetical protein
VESLPKDSNLHREVRLVTDFYMQEVITNTINKRRPDFLNIEVYQNFMASRDVVERLGGGINDCPLLK